MTTKRVSGVATLAQENTLGCGLRLASIALSSQRRAVLCADRFLGPDEAEPQTNPRFLLPEPRVSARTWLHPQDAPHEHECALLRGKKRTSGTGRLEQWWVPWPDFTGGLVKTLIGLRRARYPTLLANTAFPTRDTGLRPSTSEMKAAASTSLSMSTPVSMPSPLSMKSTSSVPTLPVAPLA
jgi:hypothetical protein